MRPACCRSGRAMPRPAPSSGRRSRWSAAAPRRTSRPRATACSSSGARMKLSYARRQARHDMLVPVTELAVPQRVLDMTGRLAEIPGVVGVVLRGSRAIGTHRPGSDVGLGVFYRGSLDVPALRALAAEADAEVLGISEIGGWGPWVNGGAWLVVDGMRVDWLY